MKNSYGELNRLAEDQKKHFARDKALPFSQQGTSQVLVRIEVFTSCTLERLFYMLLHGTMFQYKLLPIQALLKANKVCLMSCHTSFLPRAKLTQLLWH